MKKRYKVSVVVEMNITGSNVGDAEYNAFNCVNNALDDRYFLDACEGEPAPGKIVIQDAERAE